MNEPYTLSGGRAYVHERCGEVTVVSGDNFSGLCDPFQVCLGTICATCGGMDSLSKFRWEDTQESVRDYRRRMKKEAPAMYQTWNIASPLIGITGGAIGSAMLIGKNLMVDLTIGAVVGFVAMWLFIGPSVASSFGTKFYRQR